jgi:outer membrane protein assembly factor BamB
VTAALTVAADAFSWRQDLRTRNIQRLQGLWTPARAADRRLRNRATVGTLMLAAASAIVIALAGTTVAVVARSGHHEAPVLKARPATWTVNLGGPIDDTPAVADGRVFVASADHFLYALNARTDGTEWKKNVGAENSSSPAVVDGVVYIGSGTNGNVYAFDAATGKQLWVFPTGSFINSSPAVVDGIV